MQPSSDIASADADLVDRLESLALGNADYWSFRGNSKRDHGHGLMQYPAMMVPQLVRALLTAIRQVDPTVERIADPFAGSGTVLTEAMLQGLDFFGCDINPLAVLLCKVKAGPFFVDSLTTRAADVVTQAAKDRSASINASFPGCDKWFNRTVQQKLSRIRRAIRTEPASWCRRFLWVALAETVRRTSNSRTSTFKLHIKSEQQLEKGVQDPITLFRTIVTNNIERVTSLAQTLTKKEYMKRGWYSGAVDTLLTDVRTLTTDSVHPVDVVFTSPPYGDNTTTVPYGQYSYLPLQWIDLEDIHVEATADYLRTTHEIDHRSLGGSKKLENNDTKTLDRVSPALANFLSEIDNEPRDRSSRVLAFCRDLKQSLDAIETLLRPGGLMVWVLGNRQVAGRTVPLDTILEEVLTHNGAQRVSITKRRIPSKRMAIRNSVADTMSSETILIMRKAYEDVAGK